MKLANPSLLLMELHFPIMQKTSNLHSYQQICGLNQLIPLIALKDLSKLLTVTKQT